MEAKANEALVLLVRAAGAEESVVFGATVSFGGGGGETLGR